MVDGFSVEHVWLPEGKTEEISSSTNLSRLKKPEETPHLANIRDEAEKGSSSIIVCEEIRYGFKFVSIIFKKYSCVIIQPEICQNPMGSTRNSPPPWHRKLLLLQGALWSVRSFQPVPGKVGGSLREILAFVGCFIIPSPYYWISPKTLFYPYYIIMKWPTKWTYMKILVCISSLHFGPLIGGIWYLICLRDVITLIVPHCWSFSASTSVTKSASSLRKRSWYVNFSRSCRPTLDNQWVLLSCLTSCHQLTNLQTENHTAIDNCPIYFLLSVRLKPPHSSMTYQPMFPH